jgi:hypothetical protein
MALTPEQEAQIEALETPEEKAEREAAGIEKPRRGRKPGSTNKPKISDEALTAGCKQFVSLLWSLCRFPAYLVDRNLTPLSDEEKTEGAEQAKALVQRFSVLVIVLSVIGFPLWLITKVIEHAEKIIKPANKDAPVITLAPPMAPSVATENENK